MTKWEYCEVEIILLENNLYYYKTDGKHVKVNGKFGALVAQLGEDGWEMVTAAEWAGPGILKDRRVLSVFFKRPITSE